MYKYTTEQAAKRYNRIMSELQQKDSEVKCCTWDYLKEKHPFEAKELRTLLDIAWGR